MNLSKKQKRMLFRILSSAGLLLVCVLLTRFLPIPDAWYIRAPLFLIPYLAAGYDVLRKSVRNLLHGQWLDENFLMSLATVGGFVLAEYPEAVFVILFYQVGELFQSIAVGKSRRSIASLMDIRPDQARVLRKTGEETVDPADVEVGEVIAVYPGEKIPLDGEVIEGKSEVDTHSLTGESVPREIGVGDNAVSGCINQTGVLKIEVSKPYGESTVARILDLVENSALVKSKTENAVTKFAHWYTPLVVFGALALAIIPSVITGDWVRYLRTALIFLVVSCPCALVISVPLSFFGGIGCASKHGILVKGANHLEALAFADTVVFDKTGTLTEGVFSVESVLPEEGADAERLLRLAAACEENSNHPIARSLCTAAAQKGLDIPPISDVEELAGFGIRATAEGRRVAVGNARLLARMGLEVPPENAAGMSVVYVVEDDCLLGSILIGDAPKRDAKSAVEALKKMGIRRLVMLSGDREEVAKGVADAVGIEEYSAGLLPADKVEKAEALLAQKQGTLLFVGDGVNDAPVLARADVGIAMGALGSDAAIEAADIVLMDDSPAKIPHAIRIARFTKRIVRENIAFAISVKLLFLALSVFNLTSMWAATFADVGVAVLAILNAMRTLGFRGRK